MTTVELADHVAACLRESIADLPDGFYGTPYYTATGNNLTHPFTLGLLAKCVWGIEGVVHVGVDCRLKATGVGQAKCQPDIVAFSSVLKKGDSSNCLLLLDYESPNSSDGRVIYKDVDPFLNWCKVATVEPLYLVITTLPDKNVKRWFCWV